MSSSHLCRVHRWGMGVGLWKARLWPSKMSPPRSWPTDVRTNVSELFFPPQESKARDSAPYTSLSVAHLATLLLVASTGLLSFLDGEEKCGLSSRGKINLLTVALQSERFQLGPKRAGQGCFPALQYPLAQAGSCAMLPLSINKALWSSCPAAGSRLCLKTALASNHWHFLYKRPEHNNTGAPSLFSNPGRQTTKWILRFGSLLKQHFFFQTVSFRTLTSHRTG